MRRVPEVIDCWYDAGAMPFAQWGYPYQNQERFAEQFPADFISEALDQTRGWFYSLLAISTLLFGESDAVPGAKAADCDSGVHRPFPHPFRNCIVLGLMLSEWFEGKDGAVYLLEEDARAAGRPYTQQVGKMSKSKRNYREPQEIFDRYGADALRWYFFANQVPWTSIRYSERAIRESVPEFQLRLWNVFSFFILYANIDGFDPADACAGEVDQLLRDELRSAATYREPADRGELDRWILSELAQTVATVTERMDAYDNFSAASRLNDFVDALSNWYVRRSRDRFWSSDTHSPEKLDAYWTLYECLVTTAKAVAPFIPFFAEYLWRTLTSGFGGRTRASVHLCDYPLPRLQDVDLTLAAQMQLAREICSKGRAARMEQKLKVRQPLAKVEVILAEETHREWLEEHRPLIADELNVKLVEFTRDAEQYIDYEVRPNFKLLGPRVGKLMPAVKAALAEADPAILLPELTANGTCQVTLASGEHVELTSDELQIQIRAKPGWAAAQGEGCVVVLATDLTPELVREGFARDVVRFIQERRKELDCNYTDRIQVGIVTDCPDLAEAISENADYIKAETLAIELNLAALPCEEPVALAVGDKQFSLYVMRD
jgi:isoleucyl-tRNA synthetase